MGTKRSDNCAKAAVSVDDFGADTCAAKPFEKYSRSIVRLLNNGTVKSGHELVNVTGGILLDQLVRIPKLIDRCFFEKPPSSKS